jgi:hypothetical protein
MRGMRPETGPGRGVFFTRPEPSLIDALDEQVLPWGDAAQVLSAAAGQGAA